MTNPQKEGNEKDINLEMDYKTEPIEKTLSNAVTALIKKFKIDEGKGP
jgi:hypothetical protein